MIPIWLSVKGTVCTVSCLYVSEWAHCSTFLESLATITNLIKDIVTLLTKGQRITENIRNNPLESFNIHTEPSGNPANCISLWTKLLDRWMNRRSSRAILMPCWTKHLLFILKSGDEEDLYNKCLFFRRIRITFNFTGLLTFWEKQSKLQKKLTYIYSYFHFIHYILLLYYISKANIVLLTPPHLSGSFSYLLLFRLQFFLPFLSRKKHSSQNLISFFIFLIYWRINCSFISSENSPAC